MFRILAPIYNMIHRVVSLHQHDDEIINTIHEEEEEGDQNSYQQRKEEQQQQGEENTHAHNNVESNNDIINHNSKDNDHKESLSDSNPNLSNDMTTAASSLPQPPSPPTKQIEKVNNTSKNSNFSTTSSTNLQKQHASVESFFSLNHKNTNLNHNNNHHNHHHTDPPARERPKDNKWPERDSLSFTRSLVFYGTGSITEEHEKACKYIMEARMMREKYHGCRGTKIAFNGSTCNSSNDTNEGNVDGGKKLEAMFLNKNQRNVRYGFNSDGVVEVYIDEKKDVEEGANSKRSGQNESLITVPSIDEFINDYNRLEYICSNGAMRSFW